MLKEGFALLDRFPTLSPQEQTQRIKALDRILETSEIQRRDALLTIGEFRQLEKQRAYMLMVAGQTDMSLQVNDALVQCYENEIASLHEEAAFQLAEVAIALFDLGQARRWKSYALEALHHSGKARRMSRTVLRAIELLQADQENG